MRVGFLADVHAGNHKRHGGPVVAGLNSRCRAVLDVLKAAVLLANAEDCYALVVVGDLLDTASPAPQLLAALQGVLGLFEGPGGVVLDVGNHEQVSDAPGDHALGPLAPVALIVDRPRALRFKTALEVLDVLVVPHVPGDPAAWPPEDLPAFDIVKGGRYHRVLAVHRGMADDQTPAFLRSLRADSLAAWAATRQISLVIAGDWHEHRRWDWDPEVYGHQPRARVLQLGALVPTGWDNPGLDGYGTLAVYDTETNQATRHILPGPRFCVARSEAEALAVAESARVAGHQLYLRWDGPPAAQAAALLALERFRSAGAVVAAEFGPGPTDAGLTLAAARDAAAGARSASSLEEALAEFCGAAPFPEGTDRDDVLRRSRVFLGLR